MSKRRSETLQINNTKKRKKSFHIFPASGHLILKSISKRELEKSKIDDIKNMAAYFELVDDRKIYLPMRIKPSKCNNFAIPPAPEQWNNLIYLELNYEDKKIKKDVNIFYENTKTGTKTLMKTIQYEFDNLNYNKKSFCELLCMQLIVILTFVIIKSHEKNNKK